VLFDLARLGMAGDVAERLAAIASNGQSELHAAMAGAARALADSDVNAIADHADLFAEMGANVFAAEFAAAAGEGFARAGDQRRTAEWARRAAELAALCEGARTPGLRRVDEPVRLTNREREIAELAGQGLSSKLIGDRLFVSGRTVDNHLARIYTKLGVSSRTELAEVLGGIE